ncbi:hypothetical protein MPTK1_7g09750 [Marchantia polymorpha subsp. ruderalis]|uniref:Gelsolin-like domain-containing protein n=2 Tax=Marchantia polymorpha TaxID=3197 RepID=A0AAF6BXV9_MARPO|nr:hypothetical protein MARPO_0156s0006 [Marchantia polymorpha]BBN16843.1 hypothetical protein Mp_7g09750 [Marchantia polymorpha subsp. ruderalis]|eukprot:PTQ28704.1 hypothetical protein MARPO_0156s0006 [Marchantia polymorpha]
MEYAVDAAFEGAGQAPGTEIWRIEDFSPVPLPKADYGKFYTGDSYIFLQTTKTSSGALKYDLHFWLGKDTSQDEAGTAAIKTVELDTHLGDKAVQYRECQGHESDLFLSYFKSPIIPLDGGVASGFKKVEAEVFENKLFVIKGTRANTRVTQVPVARESLTHDDVFILDTKDNIFQFNGEKSSISERGKAMEVVQQLKDTNHDGSCDVVLIDEDGAEAEAEQFWAVFGGVGPIGEKSTEEAAGPVKLSLVVDGDLKEVEEATLTKDTLDTQSCYLLDTGSDVYVWLGRGSTLQEKKAATLAAEKIISSQKRPSFTRITRVTEGYELPVFKSFFQEWSQTESDE